MPTATLIRPRSMRKFGERYMKGVETPIPIEKLPAFRIDPHFNVNDSDVTPAQVEEAVTKAAEEAKEKKTKPLDPEQVFADIVVAYNGMDPDNEENFLKDGKPDARVLSRLLGYTVSAKERDEALGFDEDDKAGKKPSNLKLGKKEDDSSSDDGEETVAV